jgi:hypothetical protein
LILHLESHQAKRRAVVEQHDQDDAARHIGQVHRFLLALMEERVEVALADELCQLVIGTEVRRGECGERGGIELRLLANGRDQLPAAVHEQSTARVALVQKALQRLRDGGEVVFGERPARGTDGHESQSLIEVSVQTAQQVLAAAAQGWPRLPVDIVPQEPRRLHAGPAGQKPESGVPPHRGPAEQLPTAALHLC